MVPGTLFWKIKHWKTRKTLERPTLERSCLTPWHSQNSPIHFTHPYLLNNSQINAKLKKVGCQIFPRAALNFLATSFYFLSYLGYQMTSQGSTQGFPNKKHQKSFLATKGKFFLNFSQIRPHRPIFSTCMRFWILYDQYFPSFSYFVELSHEILGERNTDKKHKKREKCWQYYTG